MAKVSNKEPLISIIIPVYKVEKYLDRCVTSVINQTYKNLEIILVDDGSPDNCPKLCDEWAKKDKRIKVVHKKNGGLSDARNVGFKHSKGEYIGFVDSDDWIHKNMYKMLYKNMISYDADLSCCELVRSLGPEDRDKSKSFDNKVTEYDLDEFMKIFFKWGTQHCVYYAVTKLYKRELVNSSLYPVGLTSEDVLGTCKVLLKCKKIVSINTPYYYYFVNNKSITGSKFSNNDLDLLEIWDRVVELCKDTKYYEMAKYNRERIDYTLLMRMACQLTNKEINEKYKKYKDQCLKDLRKHRKSLFKAPMPISRKVTMQGILINFKLFVSICGIVHKKVK